MSVAASPRSLARLAGALYLVIIVLGLFGEMFVRGKLIVWGDPTATAERILVAESSLCLWLLVKGVDVAQWESLARGG